MSVVRAALLSMLVACGGAPEPEPQPAPTPTPQAPAPKKAPVVEAVELGVAPIMIGWNAEKRSVEIETKLVGTEHADRKEPVYVGVTVITDEDEEVDLLVHTLFPGNLTESLLFSAEIPHNPKHVLIGAWSTKVEPCKVDRPGCKEFGFVLDDSLASFPIGLYTEGTRQRFVPDDYAIAVEGEMAPVTKAAGQFAGVFGATVKTSAADLELEKGVWVKQSDDMGFAAVVAKALGVKAGVDESIATPMAIVH